MAGGGKEKAEYFIYLIKAYLLLTQHFWMWYSRFSPNYPLGGRKPLQKDSIFTWSICVQNMQMYVTSTLRSWLGLQCMREWSCLPAPESQDCRRQSSLSWVRAASGSSPSWSSYRGAGPPSPWSPPAPLMKKQQHAVLRGDKSFPPNVLKLNPAVAGLSWILFF